MEEIHQTLIQIILFLFDSYTRIQNRLNNLRINLREFVSKSSSSPSRFENVQSKCLKKLTVNVG